MDEIEGEGSEEYRLQNMVCMKRILEMVKAS
jgi:hypothetical protein